MLTFRAVAPTPDELLAHAQVHPLVPGSDAGWWLIAVGSQRTLFAMRPHHLGAEVWVDTGVWLVVPRSKLLFPRASIAPLSAIGEGVPWPTPMSVDDCIALDVSGDVAAVLREFAARSPQLAPLFDELAAMMGVEAPAPTRPRLALVRSPVDGPEGGGAA